ncbi:retrovirus-related Pol polyprotein from transposon 412 [Trichonephila clavipes]|nr:retrovirus-related Pol polyprotein from transposon 412 [Trichonephila clavipes]
MQQLCFVLDINQSLIPVYHPQANPVERKNRDLKPRLTMMVGNNHILWIEKLPAIRFALNTSKCESTDHTAAYLTFARELRTLDQVNTDLRSVIHNDNFVPEFTPYLKRFEGYMSQIKENIEMSQDRQKTYADKSRTPSPNYKVNDLVWVKLYPLSKASQNRSTKLMPRRDGPYIVLSQRSPTTFVVASCDKPDEPLGVYHTSALTPFLNGTETQSPVVPLKKRGRPRKQPLVPRGTAGENAIMSASTPPRRDGLRRLSTKPTETRPRPTYAAVTRKYRAPVQKFPPEPRKTDVWRTADNRPVCFHCGRPGHVMRYCRERKAVFDNSRNRRRNFDDVGTEEEIRRPNSSRRFTPSPTRGRSPIRRYRSPSPYRRSSQSPGRRSEEN